MTASTTLRGVAIAIAVAGAIDPVISASRRDRPVVSVLTASHRDRALADRAADALGRHFTIVRQPDAGAAAVVVVGDRAPDELDAGSAPGFALLPAHRLAIEDLDIAERTSLQSRAPVTVRLRAAGEGAVGLALRVNGLVVDRTTVQPSKTGSASATLVFAPTSAGLTRVRVEAAAGSATASVDAATDVQPVRWQVLSFDPRPSWTSTFVRRALEDDPRFQVTARIATSPKATAETGAPPASLEGSLDGFDVVVVGAPDALGAADVARLDAFARSGGSICLLPDRVADGPFTRLTGSGRWAARQLAAPVAVTPAPARPGALRASELVVPSLQRGTAVLASANGQPVVWRSPLGSGDVVVSGALDAWRQRAADGGAFATFWQTLVADAAESSRRLLDVQLGQRLFGVGDTFTVRVGVGRSGRAAAPTDQPVAHLEGAGRSEPLRLWPERPGIFAGSGVVPSTPGVYRAIVRASDAGENAREASADLLVGGAIDYPSRPALLAAWASAHGGIAVANGDVDALDRALAEAVQPPPRPVREHPMRSAWWIAPFALALGGEWWLRRRRGLA